MGSIVRCTCSSNHTKVARSICSVATKITCSFSTQKCAQTLRRAHMPWERGQNNGIDNRDTTQNMKRLIVLVQNGAHSQLSNVFAVRWEWFQWEQCTVCPVQVYVGCVRSVQYSMASTQFRWCVSLLFREITSRRASFPDVLPSYLVLLHPVVYSIRVGASVPQWAKWEK